MWKLTLLTSLIQPLPLFLIRWAVGRLQKRDLIMGRMTAQRGGSMGIRRNLANFSVPPIKYKQVADVRF